MIYPEVDILGSPVKNEEVVPVDNPRFALAVEALAKSDRLLDFNALSPIAAVLDAA